MRATKWLIATVSLFAIFIVLFLGSATRISATPEFAKKEKEPCKTCHHMKPPPKKGDSQLNGVGLCYKDNGYENLKACREKK